MNTPRIPRTDSIEQLAQFWDTHDLTDYEEELEEVAEPVFQRRTVVRIHLQSEEADAVQKIAKSKGVGYEDLIRQWVLERIQAP